MDQNSVTTLLNKAIKMLEVEDVLLLENDVNERSISHKLGEYLKNEFSGWDVDCEYNRVGKRSLDGHDFSKKLNLGPLDLEGESNVYPDIIIHKREKADNLLVIEMKKEGRNIKGDIEKLDAFIKQLKYKFGVQIKINRKEAKIVKFICGEDKLTSHPSLVTQK